MQDYFHPQMTQQELLAMSSLALAHIGDAVFELLVRTKLCVEGGTTNGRLHQQTVALVQAPAQARFALRIQPLLTPEEAAVYRRGRNAHPHGTERVMLVHNGIIENYAQLTAFRSTPRRANMPAQRGWRPCLAHCISPGRPRASRRCLPP